VKYGIIGVGAVGGYYGGVLASNNKDVHFLLRSDYNHVKKYGFIVDSSLGNFTIPKVNAYSNSKDMPKCDIVIVTLKTTSNRQLSEILPNIVKKKGIVFVLQNGLGIEENISNIVSEATILSGVTNIASNKIGPGHIRHLDAGRITFGEYFLHYKPAGITENMKLLAREFEQADINFIMTGNIGEARWEKLVWNIPYNGVSVILNATTKQIMNNLASRTLVRDMMLEVIAGANKCNFSLPVELAEKMLDFTDDLKDYKTSMMLDYKLKRPLELDAIYWGAINAAKSAGYNMPILNAIALQLEYLNSNNK